MKFENILKSSLIISVIYGNEAANAAAKQQTKHQEASINVAVRYDYTAFGYWVYMRYVPCGTTVKIDSPTVGSVGALFCVQPNTTIDIIAWGSPQTYYVKNQIIGKKGAAIVCYGSWAGNPGCKVYLRM